MAILLKAHTQSGEPQEIVNSFWQSFSLQRPGIVNSILNSVSPLYHQDPEHVEGRLVDGADSGTYAAARAACIRRVLFLARECDRQNEKYTDADFNILQDLKWNDRGNDCLLGMHIPSIQRKEAEESDLGWKKGDFAQLSRERSLQNAVEEQYHSAYSRAADGDMTEPGSAHRIDEIYDRPCFAPGASRSNLAYLQAELGHCNIAEKAHCTRRILLSNAALITLATMAALLSLTYECNKVSSRCALLLATPLLIIIMDMWRSAGQRYKGVDPKFSSSEIEQGKTLGNCWWLSAIATLSSRNDLLQRICVAWDQDRGIYGFMFHRDGLWTYTVVDDYLYLTCKDWLHTSEGQASTDISSVEAELYRACYQRTSNALHFAKCRKSNNIWLPLLEKAYAKAHGDYEALAGGHASEGVEDLTGGIASMMPVDSIKSPDRLWDELCRMNGSRVYSFNSPPIRMHRRGLTLGHAFAVEKACTYYSFQGLHLRKTRLLRMRNPWGSKDGIWQGDWGAGSKNWTPLSLYWLRPSLYEDGIFYMTFEDALKAFFVLETTRLLTGTAWTTKQKWAELRTPWLPQYNAVYFRVCLSQSSPVILTLSQLDTRYFRGLTGRHNFHLSFAVRSADAADGAVMATASRPWGCDDAPSRSLSMEKTLDAGVYDVLVKIKAVIRPVSRSRWGEKNVWSVEDTVIQSTERAGKFQQIAKNYDTAHAKLEKILPRHEIGIDGHELQQKQKRTVEPSPSAAAWNAVCGVGLKVSALDENLSLQLRHSEWDEEKCNAVDDDKSCLEKSRDHDSWGKGVGPSSSSDIILQRKRGSMWDWSTRWDARNGSQASPKPKSDVLDCGESIRDNWSYNSEQYDAGEHEDAEHVDYVECRTATISPNNHSSVCQWLQRDASQVEDDTTKTSAEWIEGLNADGEVWHDADPDANSCHGQVDEPTQMDSGIRTQDEESKLQLGT